MNALKARFAGEGSLKGAGGGFTFFWKGKPEDESRTHGVGFFKNDQGLLKGIPALPVGSNESYEAPISPEQNS